MYFLISVNLMDVFLVVFIFGIVLGVGIGLCDSVSQDVVWGNVIMFVQLVDGINIILFVVYVKVESVSVIVMVGFFQLMVNFEIVYQ